LSTSGIEKCRSAQLQISLPHYAPAPCWALKANHLEG